MKPQKKLIILDKNFITSKIFFPEESFKEILQCINRLENMSSESAEAGILRTYLECIFDLPWENETKDNPNIMKAKKNWMKNIALIISKSAFLIIFP